MYNLFYSDYDGYANHQKNYIGSFSSVEKAQERVSQREDNAKHHYDNLDKMCDNGNYIRYEKEITRVLPNPTSDELIGYIIEPIVLDAVE